MNLNDLHQQYRNLQNVALPETPTGIKIECATARDIASASRQFQSHLAEIGIDQHVLAVHAENSPYSVSFCMSSEWVNSFAADCDTLQLSQRLNFYTNDNPADLEQEILLSMLLSPAPFQFPSYQELAAALRIRKNIVINARKTALAFSTEAAERPSDCWTYDEDTGFTILPGQSLITALQKATQPDESGKLYSFSCYRATEYVILLGVAQELESCNQELFNKLQQQWETKAIKSGSFHEVFMTEYGSMTNPLPHKYYVPGDRVWFRNPDKDSSEITGYEGSWVFYIGGGLFTNFWKSNFPYTLTSKCVEIYHWRNATWRDQEGELQIDENIVEERVRNSMNNPAEVRLILEEMLRYREPLDININGGCIDTTREYPRYVCPGTSDMVLPNNRYNRLQPTESATIPASSLINSAA
jgi:hypothetical protein